MSGTLALSAAIAAMDRDALTSLVRYRRPQSVASITDPIGLAVELLRSDSIERAIRPLERGDLAALVQPGSAAPQRVERLLGMGLLGWEDGTPLALPEVHTTLAACLEQTGLGVADLNAEAPAGTTSGAASDTAAWYVPALTAVGVAAETLRGLRARPGSLNRSGTIAVATVKALSDSTGIPTSDISCSLDALMAAGLLAQSPADAQLVWSPASQGFLEQPSPERWAALACAVASTMPAPLRLLVRESDYGAALQALPHRFPLLPAATVSAITRFGELAAHLGLVLGDWLSEAGRSLSDTTRTGPAEALAIAWRDMPPPAAGVYIQPDLSVIVPGPLAPADEAALAALSEPEQTGVASTRRISEASLTEALERGLDAREARATLERLSLTGIPQPLGYMLTSLATRVRSIIVHEHHGDSGRTRIELARPELRDTLLVDRALHHLQLTPGPDAASLYSKLRADHVLAALGDARHTASYAAASGEAAPRVAEPVPARTGLPEDLATLVDRVHDAATAEPGASGFTRRLELAIKDRSTVRVTASAQGRTHVFTLLPTSLHAGRLRATDPRAGVERTLPVSTITAVE